MSAAPTPTPPSGVLTGTLTYREPAPLTAEARALVALVEGAGRPTAGSIVASNLMTEIGQKPIGFVLEYANANIDPNTTYTVVATIVDGDRVWTTSAGTPVITKGNPRTGLDLELTLRADLVKGNVTGAISGVDIELTETAFSAAVIVDLSSDTSVGFDVNLDPITVPIAFKVPFDPATIDPDRTYVVTGAIFDASDRWANQTGVPVITEGNPVAGITVPVSPLGAAEAGDDGLSLLGIILGLIGLAALIAAIVLCHAIPPTTRNDADSGRRRGCGRSHSAARATAARQLGRREPTRSADERVTGLRRGSRPRPRLSGRSRRSGAWRGPVTPRVPAAAASRSPGRCASAAKPPRRPPGRPGPSPGCSPARSAATSSRWLSTSHCKRVRVVADPLLEALEPGYLVGRLELDRLAAGTDLAAESTSSRSDWRSDCERVALLFLGTMDRGQPAGFPRRDELHRRHDMGQDDPDDLDAVWRQRLADRRSQPVGLGLAHVEDLIGDPCPDEQADAFLARRLAHLVEVGRGDREHEPLRRHDLERHQDVDVRSDVVAGRDLHRRGVERRLPHASRNG